MKTDERQRHEKWQLNMKTYKNLYKKMLSGITVENAFYEYRKGRFNKIYVQEFHKDIMLNIAKILKQIQQGYPYVEHHPKEIYDGISRKKRIILVPSNEEQLLHHVIIQVLKPILSKSMYQHSYASLPKKGCQKGKRFVEKWIQKDIAGTQYYLKMDIKKYFENIDHNILRSKLSKKIKDKKFMEFIEPTISIPLDDHTLTTKGLPLGFYTSQWYSNFYLTDFDHWVVEQLKVKHYIRYMDDLIIFGECREELKQKEQLIEEWLYNNLKLEIKPAWRIVKLGNNDGEDLDFMGYRFYRNRTTIRRKVMYGTSKKARKLAKQNRPNSYEAKQMLSKIGRWKHTNTYYLYQKEIIPYINVKQLKSIVSFEGKYISQHLEFQQRRIEEYVV